MADLKKVLSKASEFEKNQSIAMAKEFIDVKEKIDEIEIPEIPEQDNSDIVEAIKNLKIEKPDNTNLENIMQKIADKKDPKEKEFPNSMDVNIKNQKEFPSVQKVEMSEPKWYNKFNYDTILTGMKSILEKVTIKTKTDDILDVHILDKNDKIIDKFGKGKETDVQHGGYFSGWLKNVLGTVINPATEDTLSTLNDKFIVHDNHIQVLDYIEGIGHGSTNGDIETKRTVGKKSAITTGAYTILESAAFIQPIADTQMYLQSASANDTATGSGAQQITIKYFSLAWGAEKTVQVTPDGINQVTIPVTDIYRIQEIFVNKGSIAADNITITNQAETVLYGEIEQYETFMERCIFYVAENKRLTITQALLGSTTSGGVNIRIFVSEEDSDGNVVTRGRDVIEVADNTAIVNLEAWESVTNPNNKRIAVGLAVSGNAPAQKCTGTLKGFIETI